MTSADDQADGWTWLDPDTLVDEGLLRRANCEFFWPLGLALTASQTKPTERVEPAVEALAEGLDLTDEQRSRLAKNVAAMGKVRLAGLDIQATVPAEPITSALSPEEAADKDARAAAWIGARRKAMGLE